MEKIPVIMPTVARPPSGVIAIRDDVAKLSNRIGSGESFPVDTAGTGNDDQSESVRQPRADNRTRAGLNVPKPSSVLILAGVAALGLYTYATIKDGGVVVNEQTGERRSVYRWVDIGLGITAALYILGAIRTL